MLIDLFFAPMQVFQVAPLAALVPGAAFLAAFTAHRIATRGRPRDRAALLMLVAGLAWVGYAFYELRMQAWARTVVAPIRVDLVLGTPILYALTVLGLIAWWRVRRALQPGAPPSQRS